MEGPEKLLGCKRGRSPRLDLRLNSSSSSEMTTMEGSSSFVPGDTEEEERVETRAMLLVGCRRCLMYVLLSDVDPKCPKCKSTVLLDFLNSTTSSSSAAAAANKPDN